MEIQKVRCMDTSPKIEFDVSDKIKRKKKHQKKTVIDYFDSLHIRDSKEKKIKKICVSFIILSRIYRLKKKKIKTREATTHQKHEKKRKRIYVACIFP